MTIFNFTIKLLRVLFTLYQPFFLSLRHCPEFVWGGIFKFTFPSGVGTLITAPNIASSGVIGIYATKSSPSNSNKE